MDMGTEFIVCNIHLIRVSSIQSEFRVRRNLRPWNYQFDDVLQFTVQQPQLASDYATSLLYEEFIRLHKKNNNSLSEPRSEPLGIAKIK